MGPLVAIARDLCRAMQKVWLRTVDETNKLQKEYKCTKLLCVVFCCVVSCRVVLCCVVLCCVVLCCVVLCCVVLNKW